VRGAKTPTPSSRYVGLKGLDLLDRSVGASSIISGDIPASHMGSWSPTPLLRNPTDVRHCSQHAGANVDFGDEGAVDWAFLGNLKQLRALLLG